MDGECTSFAEFALTCARAFGACVTLREEPLGLPIPEFQVSPYYLQALEEAQQKLQSLKDMTAEERAAFGQTKRDSVIQQYGEMLARDIERNLRLDRMKKQVEAWEPPSEEHVRLKQFMLDQLEISRENISYFEQALKDSAELPPEEYYAQALQDAERSCQYYTGEVERERNTVSARNEWVAALRQSLDQFQELP